MNFLDQLLQKIGIGSDEAPTVQGNYGLTPTTEDTSAQISSAMQGQNQGGGQNFLAQVFGGGGQQEQQNSANPDGLRKRGSVVDIVGRIADALAVAGGGQANYRASQDSILERQRQQRQDEMNNRLTQQKLAGGDAELRDARFQRYGQATRGLAAVYDTHGAEGVNKAWPVLAQQLGLNDAESSLFAQNLSEDPEGTIAMFNAATNDAKSTGSLPKEIMIGQMLDKRDPSGQLSQEYWNGIATGDRGMTEYQRAQLAKNDRDYGYKVRKDQRDYRLNTRKVDISERKGTGGKNGEATSTAIASARSTLSGLRNNYKALNDSGAITSANRDAGSNIVARTRASGVGQLAESFLGTDAQTYRDNIKAARPALIQGLAKATGMTSQQLNSNVDMKLMLDQATDPTMSYETNMAALERIETLINGGSGSSGSSRGNSPKRTVKRRAPGGSGKRTTTVSNW